jgi:hypothetical protein
MHCVAGPTRRSEPVCYDRTDLASMYEFAMPYMSGDPIPLLTAASVWAACTQLHSTRDAEASAAGARVSESARRSARAGRLYNAILQRLDDSEGASGENSFLVLSSAAPLEGYAEDGKTPGPALTAGAASVASGCSSYGSSVGTVPEGSTGHEWVTRYRQSVANFRDAWASCMREELGSTPADGTAGAATAESASETTH